jgi:hypothetical protein
MTLELKMTLAEALIERKALKERLDNLEDRLTQNVSVQEGSTPAEMPEALQALVDEAIADLEQLIVAINRTNLAARLPGKEGWSLMEAIARRDMLTLHQNILVETIDQVRMAYNRTVVTRSEVRTIITVDVAVMQKKIDALAKERRTLDARLQAANWNVQLEA